MVAAIGAFVIIFAENQVSFWSPFVFAFAVVLFALEKGGIHRFLRLKPFLFIGMLSYSIYLMHRFVQLVIANIGKILEQKFNLEIFHPTLVSPEGFPLLGTNLWVGDLWQIGTFVLVIIAGFITYTLIENPANRWCRRYLQQKEHRNVPELVRRLLKKANKCRKAKEIA